MSAGIMSKSKGRPSKFNAGTALAICEHLAAGMTLREVCRQVGMPAESTVRAWAIDDREGFSAQYAQAREIGYHVMADELLEIADDGTNDWMERQNKDGSTFTVLNGEHVQRSRLRVDTRKWLLSKALPKIYGDKAAMELTGKDGDALIPDSTSEFDKARLIAHVLSSAMHGETRH